MDGKEHLKIQRKASDNKYLHRDFHVSADIGIGYVGELYGDDGVKEYLTQYAESVHKPLAEKVKKEGLRALEKHFKEIYAAEECEDRIRTNITKEGLEVKISSCPAVEFMKKSGHTPSRWYGQTTETVYNVLADMCGLGFELKFYDDETGAAEFTFKK